MSDLEPEAQSAPRWRVLILEARFYGEISDALRAGAIAALEAAGAGYTIIEVPGALEIPTALALACRAGHLPYDAVHGQFHGCLALGCVIRGETAHFDIVAQTSAAQLMAISAQYAVPVGNGILTVENEAQAWARARASEKDKGGEAARACIRMMQLADMFYGRG